MTFKQKVIAAGLTGGAVALFFANLLIRIDEARADKPLFVSDDWLRKASADGGCYTGE